MIVINDLVFEDEFLQFPVGLIQVIVDNSVVVGTGGSIIHLGGGGSQSLGDGVVGFGASANQSCLQILDGWWGDEQESGVQIDLGLDRFDTLHIDVQDTGLPGVDDLLDRCYGGTVVVAGELGPLDELVALDHGFEVFDSGKVIVLTVNLTRSSISSGGRHTESKGIWELSK